MLKLGLWAVWLLSFPAPGLWEVLQLFFYYLFLWFLCGLFPGCGLFFIVCVVLSGGFVSGRCPFPMFLGEVMPDFRFFLVAFGFLYCSWLFVGLWPFGNKFLLIQKRKNTIGLVENSALMGIVAAATYRTPNSQVCLYFCNSPRHVKPVGKYMENLLTGNL